MRSFLKIDIQRILIWVMAIICFGGGAIGTFASDEKPVSMLVSSGYESAGKANRYFPVQVQLNNHTLSSFTGTVSIFVQEADYELYEYEFPVVLEANQEKKETFHIPLGVTSDELQLILYDDKQKEVSKETLHVTINNERVELFVGILSNSPQKLEYLKGLSLMGGGVGVRSFLLSEETLSWDELGLDLLDVLLITDYDASQLSKSQVYAVEEWVHKGGTLLLGTGERGTQGFQPFLGSLFQGTFEELGVQEIDMGIEYAENQPGDSLIALPCVEVFLEDGTDVITTDQLSVLTSVKKGNGIVAVAAYDFIDLEFFVGKHSSYMEMLVADVLSEETLSFFSNVGDNWNSSKYWLVQSMLNTGDMTRFPNLGLYTVLMVVYIVLIGPGLYIFLKGQERRRYYRTGTLLLSLLFVAVIYIMGGSTRFKSAFATYATIKEVKEEEIVESTYINVRSPYKKGYSISLHPEYELQPVTRNFYYEMAPAPPLMDVTKSQLTVRYDKERTTIHVKEAMPFNPIYFSLKRQVPNEDHIGLKGQVTSFDGKITGSITNYYDFPVENVAVLLSGGMVMLGSMEPLETKSLNDLPVIYYPSNYTHLVAERISGTHEYRRAEVYNGDYLMALARTNVLNFYLEDVLMSKSEDAKIIAFKGDNQKESIVSGSVEESSGITLYTSTLPVNTRKGDLVYRSSLQKKPSVLAGGYDDYNNMAYIREPVTLEYSLGNELEIETISFDQLAKNFLMEEGYEAIVPFSGTMYFYNHDKNRYDKMETVEHGYGLEELTSYLSPSNTLTVKYVGDSSVSTQNGYVMLPVIRVVGRDK